MAIKTTLEQLEEVQDEISKILRGGQDLAFSDKRVIHARLAALTDRENILLRRYHAESGSGGARNVGIIKRD